MEDTLWLNTTLDGRCQPLMEDLHGKQPLMEDDSLQNCKNVQPTQTWVAEIS